MLTSLFIYAYEKLNKNMPHFTHFTHLKIKFTVNSEEGDM